MVVLPALDLSLDEESWQNLAPSHAQYALKQLLERMKISRAEVLPWPSDMVPTAPAARSSAVNAALWPALRTAGWRHVEIETSAFRDVQFLEAASDTEEARAIALHVRAHLETPAKTIAIVTADRALARRISSALSRFDIAVDDSAGSDLAKTSAAVLLLQLARVAANGLLPVDLLALLKHPLCTAGLGRAPWLERVRLLDAEVLRGIRPASGLQGLQLAIAAAFKYPLKTESNTLVSDLHERLTRCAAGFFDLMQQTHVRAQDLLQAHIAAAEMLASSDIVAGDVLLWRGDAGDLLAQTVRDLAAALPPDMELATDSYAMWFEEVLAGKVVRPRYGRHPRVSLLSPIEARLQREDVMILAGLNEGTWPPAPEVDPFLADHMREKLGLPTSEFRLGQSAHDFAQSLGAKEVLLTRSQKSGGAPTLASRFWLRLSALCGDAIAPADTLLAQTRALDQTPLRPAAAPMPVPPQAARPPEIYVSDMTLWRQNPYAFYARRFLNLTPLDDIDADPGPQQRGIALHTALEHFFKREAPKRTLANLLADGEAAFADMMDRPLLRAFWWPRFVTLAKAVVADEKLMVPADVKIHVEKTGGWDMPTTFPLTIKGRADRIDEQPDKKLVIYDYKSGGTPSGEEVRYARQPQMALLALIAQAGSFSDIAKHEVAALKYVLLKGRLPEPLELKELVKKNWSDVSALTALTADILTRWVNLFDVDRQPYRFLQIPDRKPGHEYDHLARVSEWRGRGVP
jgi:ATP-dependent helicase/nuclease subunit B